MVTVLVECIGCGKRYIIGPDEIPVGEQPECDDCLMPMIPVEARKEL